MREASLRRFFLRRMKACKCIVHKQTPTGRRGKPDDLVLAPRGRVFLVELKKPGEVPEAHQALYHRRLARRGHKVRVIDTHAGVLALEAQIRRPAPRCAALRCPSAHLH